MHKILGVKVDSVTRSEAIERVAQMFRDGGQHIVTTPNPEIIVAAQNEHEFREILNRASLALPDGFGLMLAAGFLGTPLKARIAGSDFVWDIAQLAASRGYTIYLLGGKGNVAAAAAKELGIRNQELRIAGYDAGPQSVSSIIPDSPFIIHRIKEAVPDILLVALGHGTQEKWIAAHLTELTSVKVAMGVGGALDFIAGRVARAPRILRLVGLEWLWRLIRQPWRLPRIWRAVIVFPLLVVRVKFWYNGK